jgi:hypothetical protein
MEIFYWIEDACECEFERCFGKQLREYISWLDAIAMLFVASVQVLPYKRNTV